MYDAAVGLTSEVQSWVKFTAYIIFSSLHCTTIECNQYNLQTIGSNAEALTTALGTAEGMFKYSHVQA